MQQLQNVRTFLKRPIPYLRGTIGEYLIVFIVLCLLTFFYTDWIVLDITHKIFTRGTGDATAGFLWLITTDNDWNPQWAHTFMTNFPQGEDLQSPIYITWTLLLTPLWLLAKFVNPIAALNIVTFAGFISCGFAAYAVIKRLTNMWTVAAFAAFTTAFYPYHIFKASGHLSNVFSWMFIVLFGLFITFWQRPTAIKAILIALVMAAGFYTDGYFLLLVPVFMAALFLAGILYDLFFRVSWAAILQKLKYTAIAIATLVVLSIPIVKAQFDAGTKVSSDLGRTNIKAEAQYYSAKPLDYLLPPYLHPYFSQFETFNSLQEYKNIRSNLSENALYLGYVVLVLFVAGATVAVARFIQWLLGKHRTKANRMFIFYGMTAVITVAICFSFTLPLEIHVFGHAVRTPADYVTSHLSLWRVFTRFIMPMHAVMVLFAALILAMMIRGVAVNWRSKMRYLPLLLIPVVAFEYASNINRPAWSLSNMTPAYTWLSQQADIRSIAELPYNDAPYGNPATYFTAQYIHKKMLVNGRLDTSEQREVRRTQEGPTDPEAIEYAIARGADAIVTHTRPCKTYPHVTLAHQDDGICIFRVDASAKSKVDNYFITPEKGFNLVDQQPDATYNTLRNGPITMELIKARQELPSRSSVRIVSFTVSTNRQSHPIQAKVTVAQGEKQLYVGDYTDGRLRVDLHTVATDRPITLTISPDEPTLDDQYVISRIVVGER